MKSINIKDMKILIDFLLIVVLINIFFFFHIVF